MRVEGKRLTVVHADNRVGELCRPARAFRAVFRRKRVNLVVVEVRRTNGAVDVNGRRPVRARFGVDYGRAQNANGEIPASAEARGGRADLRLPDLGPGLVERGDIVGRVRDDVDAHASAGLDVER